MHPPHTSALVLAVALTLEAHSFAQAVRSASTPKPAAGKDQITGEWEGHLVDGDGANPGQRRMNISLTIDAKTITAHGGGNTGGAGAYRISGSTGKVARIDATGTAGQYDGKRYEGIISIEGDTLKWCSANPGKQRPREMKTNTGAGQFLMVLTRKR